MPITENQLFNPRTFVESTGGGGFQEGRIKVEESFIEVYKRPDPRPRDGQELTAAQKRMMEESVPHVCLTWRGPRLDEKNNVMTDENGPLIEELRWGFGKGSLEFMHPADASSPEAGSSSRVDKGAAVGTRGQTVKFVKDFEGLNNKAAAAVLFSSLEKAGISPVLTNRAWAPDWVGGIFYVKAVDPKTVFPNDKAPDFAFTYKVVTQVIQVPAGMIAGTPSNSFSAPAPAVAATGVTGEHQPPATAKASSNGSGTPEQQALISSVLRDISDDTDSGTVLKRKAFLKEVGERMQKKVEAMEFDGTLPVPALKIIRNDQWMKDNLPTWGLIPTVVGDSVTEVLVP